MHDCPQIVDIAGFRGKSYIATRTKAKADNLKPTVIVQFQDNEVDLDTLVEAAKADFHQAKKRTLITGLKLYVKSKEHMAYGDLSRSS